MLRGEPNGAELEALAAELKDGGSERDLASEAGDGFGGEV
jgi:hypothetical protein